MNRQASSNLVRVFLLFLMNIQLCNYFLGQTYILFLKNGQKSCKFHDHNILNLPYSKWVLLLFIFFFDKAIFTISFHSPNIYPLSHISVYQNTIHYFSSNAIASWPIKSPISINLIWKERKQDDIRVRGRTHSLPQHIKKTLLHVKWITQNINWMLAEELKTPKRARNSWHKWVDQKKKTKEREKETGWD